MGGNISSKIVITIMAILIAGTIGCSSQDTIPEIMFKRFDLNKTALNHLANEMLKDSVTEFIFHKNESTNLKANEFPEPTATQLTSLGLLDVSWHYSYCTKAQQILFIYKTNWIPKDSLFIVYNRCDSVETKRDFYRKDDNKNEIWGLGDYWQMIKIVKYKVKDL